MLFTLTLALSLKGEGIAEGRGLRVNPGWRGAREGIRTPNLTITNRLRYRCATRAPFMIGGRWAAPQGPGSA